MKKHQYNKAINSFAHDLRHTMTKAEVCMWKYALRASMMCGYSFRRQKPIGSYIADFACMELRLVIEIDGVTHLHTEVQSKDIAKDTFLTQEGFTVLRFMDEEVLRNMEEVKLNIERCIRALEEKKTFDLPLPPPRGGG